MKPIHYIAIFFFLITVYLLYDKFGAREKFDPALLETLQKEKEILVNENVRLKADLYSTEVRLNNSINNTNQLRLKYEKKRQATAATPVDSLFIRIQKRSSDPDTITD